MRYRIIHSTEYRYTDTVSQCHNVAHLIPRDTPHQRCLQSRIDVDPVAADYAQRHDFFGNPVSFFSTQIPHQRLAVIATSEVQVAPEPARLDLHSGTSWQGVKAHLSASLQPEDLDARQYLLDSPLVVASEALAAYARPSFQAGRPLLEVALELVDRIHNDFRYEPGFTSVTTPLEEVLRDHRGVCQDFAHLAIGCLRAMGLPARYVSGYLETVPPPGQERLQGADASHAWFSVYVPQLGWLDLDPTNNQRPMGRHITTAWGRDFSDVTPLKGVIFGGGAGHGLAVSVDVERLE